MSQKDLFSGRGKELSRVLDAIFQRGQHVVIYGERGVGKTSLANVISDWLAILEKHNYQLVRYNCAAGSTFQSIWTGIFRELSFVQNLQPAGFGAAEQIKSSPMSLLLPENVSSEDVRFLLQRVQTSTIIVIDEYDRVQDEGTSKLLADTIKSLSDHSVDTTLIIIGVADSVDELILEHRSIERAIVQIQMPRMSDVELMEILDKGFEMVKMPIDSEAKLHITALSQGLPHNTHELALHAGYAAVDDDRMKIESVDLDKAICASVDNARQTIVSTYHRATSSPQKNIFREVLLAAALAPTDELGYFAAGDLRQPLQLITKRAYSIDGYMRHLNDFCSEERGMILEKKGERRKYRFRFSDSIMEPFVVMKGIKDDMISEDVVVKMELQGRLIRHAS